MKVQPELLSSVSSSASIATTSGTLKEWLLLPATTKKAQVNFAGVSTNGTNNIILQVGSGGVYVTTGYLGATGAFTASVNQPVLYTNGVNLPTAGTVIFHGGYDLTLMDPATNTWRISLLVSTSDSGRLYIGSYTVSLPGPLDSIRFFTADGVDTFDAGKANLNLEV